MNGDCNVRSGSYFIALRMGTCACCRAPTRLVALVLPPGHQTSALDGLDDPWEAASWHAFLFHIGYLPDSVQRRLQEIAPAYCLAPSGASLGTYWANHCERCGTQLHDHDLFCEPDVAFLPTSAEGAAAILLLRTEEPIEAAAAGYAYEPYFFSAMRDA